MPIIASTSQGKADVNTISGRVTAGGAAPGQQLFYYAATITNPTGNTTIFTVPAGVTAYVTDFSVTWTGTSAVLVALEDGATVIYNGHANSTKGIEMPGIETQPQVAGGDALNINATGTGVLAYFVAGYLQ